MQPRNMSMSGVVDLAAVKAAQEAKAKAEQARAESARQGGGGAVSPADLVIDVDEAGFESEVLQRSTEVPVVIDFWAEWCQPCKQLSPVLERLAVEYDGKFVLAKIDVDANQMLMQQFGIQGIPAVFAVVAGQALPLFQGAAPEQQIRSTLDQLVQVAEERFGLTGLVVDPDAEAVDPVEEAPQIPAGPYDHLLEAAVHALDAGDFGGAVQAYKNVLSDDPGNTEAGLGLAQAELLQRVQGADPQDVRKAAAENPGDAQAQIAAADLDLVGGHVEDAFGRLIDTVRLTAGDDRDAVRRRLLELFEVVGGDDPRVAAARRALARALF
ncbi:tetratricopeptide repeat protein [Streptomyces europaeiscabiei]|uniref:Tetratricopeptide repeat protein n=1 Tax=Streptomyces europaeiscabiei TaxID=146819 RepID=A0ABU4NSJ3_9ACTN|nr:MULTISPECIES: tetratricopeptide repeat protein [Streptomyces]MDX2530618.1 tetratricopeptide repeat protein [Streptomyces europaeiscabiei]MDX2763432.1 tetratricopeptide repeat protein [Streptomyces europaeiscabiei]MDX2773127.1 tetratricopeptide repeat protein [Streptomyces europaeiscabiei]MDX3548143.1 tetratricopeptide repeat protein [Streptomyces europaeiscabiei]MDX3557351.1 tetratricopeptide repeat protein [Streptomyces europaeiscabiei]